MTGCRFIKYGFQAIVICLIGLATESHAQLLSPIITVPPLGTSVQNGGTATFSATVVSLTIPSFTWLFNGRPVSSANTSIVNNYILGFGTISTLTISNVIPANAGSYSVKVSNGVSSPVTSISAALSVIGGISVDNVSSASTNGATLQWLHTVGSGNNRILIVTTANHDGNQTVTGVTYGGVTLTQVGMGFAPGNGNSCSLWSLVAPAPGTASVVVTLSGAVPVVAGAVSFTGVQQALPIGSFVSTNGNHQSPTETQSAAAGDVVMDIVSANGNSESATAGVGQFQQWNRQTGTSGGDIIGGCGIEAGANKVATSWTLESVKPWALGAIALTPAMSNAVYIASSGAGMGMTTNGFTFQLFGPAGSNYVIQASPDLVNWVPISTNAAPTGSVSFTDTAAKSLSFRYYRAMIQ
jgi:hypothetical protein